MNNNNVIDQFISENELKLAKETIKKTKIALYQLLTFHAKDFNQITAADIREWLMDLEQKGCVPVTILRKIHALRLFFRYCLEENLVEEEPTKNITLPKIPDRLPVYLSREALTRLREVAQKDVRNQAIIETLYATGVRANELINICLEDINWESRQIRIWGKGNKERIVLFTALCAERLKEYLRSRQDANPFLVLGRQGKQLIDRVLNRIFEDYSKKLGFRVTPHTLRHTFAEHLAEKGMPFSCIQDLLGHDKVKDTRVYTRLYEHARRKKYDKYF